MNGTRPGGLRLGPEAILAQMGMFFSLLSASLGLVWINFLNDSFSGLNYNWGIILEETSPSWLGGGDSKTGTLSQERKLLRAE